MKDLYFIVEGETESEFVKELLIPHLNNNGVTSNIQPIKITMSGGGHGFNKIEHLRNTIQPLLSYENRPVITTMVDFFRIPNGIPGYPECMEMNLVDD